MFRYTKIDSLPMADIAEKVAIAQTNKQICGLTELEEFSYGAIDFQ